MTKLIIPALILMTGLASASVAATINGSGPGSGYGMCRPTETDMNPCGTGWFKSPPAPAFHVHHHEKVTSHANARMNSHGDARKK
jgi:hypothetical protein